MNRKIRLFLLFLCCATLNAEQLFTPDGTPVSWAGKFSPRPVQLPNAAVPRKEFRGVWVATVENIDFGPFASAAEFRTAAAKLMRTLAARHFNAVLFQVRSNCDAWYVSRENPWSRYLSGTEGVGIGVDPLAILIAEAHRNGLEFHAWLNPYRVIGATQLGKKAYLQTLSRKNFARRFPELVLDAPAEKKGYRSYFLNPGEPEVRRHIVRNVREILDRYNVDAIHFDDYFYLYSVIGNADHATFVRYNTARQSLGDWRRDNVTAVIRSVKNEITAYNRKSGRKVAFGVSPFGIWANRSAAHPDGSYTGGKESYSLLYADVRKWIRMQYIDYVIPQLYWGFAHRIAAYAALADWWADQVRGTSVRLFTGHALYRLGSSSEFPDNEIYNQLRYNSLRPEISGFSLYSARHILHPEAPKTGRGVRLLFKRMATPAERITYPNVR